MSGAPTPTVTAVALYETVICLPPERGGRFVVVNTPVLDAKVMIVKVWPDCDQKGQLRSPG
jgi:hypothetical protein